LLDGSPESALHAEDSFTEVGLELERTCGVLVPGVMGKQQALKRYTIDLTEQARNGKLDPIVGRDEEIRQVIDILMRRRQNNPILIGEAGVGKTAVVEGFAQYIVEGNVPNALKDVVLCTLDLALLQAGAGIKGEFENRLRQVIEDVQASEKPVILFIDEAHTLVGAGGAMGTGDAANLLKPALARGTLRTVAATTWAEYKTHIEKDAALSRRFQTVHVAEPSEEKAILMMRGIVAVMEQHHQVQILDEALEAAVKLSHRYIPERQLPDKAICLLDTTCARVAVSQHATPAVVDDSRKRIDALEIEQAIITRETAIGLVTTARNEMVGVELRAEQVRLKELESRWATEKELITQILSLQSNLRNFSEKLDGELINQGLFANDCEHNTRLMINEHTVPEHAEQISELKILQARLNAHQGEHPMILACVDHRAIAAVVQDWTGIPVGRMLRNEIDNILKIADILSRRIIGQHHALEMIARRIQTSRAGLDNPGKPIGVFCLPELPESGKQKRHWP